MTDFIFFGSKINVDGDPCQEIKTCLLLGKKSMTNLDHWKNNSFEYIDFGRQSDVSALYTV